MQLCIQTSHVADNIPPIFINKFDMNLISFCFAIYTLIISPSILKDLLFYFPFSINLQRSCICKFVFHFTFIFSLSLYLNFLLFCLFSYDIFHDSFLPFCLLSFFPFFLLPSLLFSFLHSFPTNQNSGNLELGIG